MPRRPPGSTTRSGTRTRSSTNCTCKAFFDSNDDGIGDFRGLTEKLDYIQDLGVNTHLAAAVLSVADAGRRLRHRRLSQHPSRTTARASDFRHFVREAHRRGFKVITELVINHTSDQHPWFQAARRAPPGSAKRDYYVWSDRPSKYAGTRIIFTDTETSNWTWDDVAKPTTGTASSAISPI